MPHSFKLLFVLIALSLTSCFENGNKAQTTATTPDKIPESVIKHPQLNANDDQVKWDTIQFDRNYIPQDTNFITKILAASNFHSNEVWEKADTDIWWGIFRSSTGYYLSETKIKTTRVRDMMDKDEDLKTGWSVEAKHIDTAFLLFTDLPGLTEHKIQRVNINPRYIWPGDTITFRYNNAEYTLYATGGKTRNKSMDSNWYDVWNYKLYLSITKDDNITSQLIVAAPYFNATMAQIDFIGDIDGDGILDLIINTTPHYNVYAPTLYLSRYADKGNLFKIAGRHWSVGC